MTVKQDIKNMLRRKPYYSAARIAEELGVDRNVVQVTASRNKIRFMDRRQLEDLLDGEKIDI